MSPFETDVPVALHLDQGDSLTDLAVITNSPFYECWWWASATNPFQELRYFEPECYRCYRSNILKIFTLGGRASTLFLKDQRNLMAQVNTTCEVVNNVFGYSASQRSIRTTSCFSDDALRQSIFPEQLDLSPRSSVPKRGSVGWASGDVQ